MTDLTIMPENYDNIRTGIVELLRAARSTTARNVIYQQQLIALWMVKMAFVWDSTKGRNTDYAFFGTLTAPRFHNALCHPSLRCGLLISAKTTGPRTGMTSRLKSCRSASAAATS